jgi:hypothetical protein
MTRRYHSSRNDPTKNWNFKSPQITKIPLVPIQNICKYKITKEMKMKEKMRVVGEMPIKRAARY